MPKYVIEREIPGAGKLSAQDLQGISQKSCSVLQNLGPQIQWLESYVTDDKVYCVYLAPDEAARLGRQVTGHSSGRRPLGDGDRTGPRRLELLHRCWHRGSGRIMRAHRSPR